MNPAPEPYEIFAVRYAQRDGTRNDNLLFHDPHDGPMGLDYFVWAIVGNGRTILLDTGYGPEVAKLRGHNWLMGPEEGLRRIGIAPESVQHIIISHLHNDHCGNLENFPNARIYLQDREMRYATGRFMANKRIGRSFHLPYVKTMIRAVYDERVDFIDGDHNVAPGIEVYRTGGHTDGLQFARVWTKRGWVVLAADASHFYENVAEQRPYRTVFSVGDMLEGHRKIMRLAGSIDYVIPGHDPQVMHLYPAVSKDAEGIAVRLDVQPAK